MDPRVCKYRARIAALKSRTNKDNDNIIRKLERKIKKIEGAEC